MSYQCLTLDVSNKIAHIQLNRPEQCNAMNPTFWQEFPRIVKAIDDEALARAIVISSTGKHFCSGMDLSVFTGDSLKSEGEVGRQREKLRRTVLDLQATFTLLEQVRMPVLVAIQGGCMGAGVDMVTACDSRYCTEDAFFSIEETNIGMTADVGTLQRLPHLISHGLTRELAYTGRRLLADEACRAGLVNQVFADQQSLLNGVMDLAGQIAARSPLAVAGCKEMLNYSRDHSVADSLNYIATWQSGMYQPQHDMMEAFTAKAEKRKPQFEELTGNSPPFSEQ